MDIQLSQEQSQVQADIIQSIAVDIVLLNVPYCKEVVKQLRDKASRHESMSVLSANYSQKNTDLIRAQAKALEQLCSYVDALKEIEEIKKEISIEQQQRSDIFELLFS